MSQNPFVFSHDGSFEGLLCAFAAAEREGLEHCGFVSGEQIMRSLWPPIPVPVNAETAGGFLDRVRRAGGASTIQHLVYVYLAEVHGFEEVLYPFLHLTLRAGRNVLGMRTHPAVLQVARWKAMVAKETHRFTGLMRFMELRDGVLYARFEPDHNILLILASHFQHRFAQESLVIHDTRRGLALAWDGQALHPVVGVPEDVATLLSQRELDFQCLWHEYVQALAIPERRNPELQRRLMPRRYWKHLVERPD